MDLLGQSQELTPQRKRVDGATVFKRFTKAVKDNGGDDFAYRQSIITETQELFDCDVDQLYRETGGRRNRRETLPQPVQEAYMVNESLAANELDRQRGTIGGDSQEEVNGQIVESVRQTSRRTRGWLPW